MGAMLYTKDKITSIKDFMKATLESEKENYRNLIDSLENGLVTLDTNLNEVQTSINLISNNPETAFSEDYSSSDYSDDSYDNDSDDDYDDDDYDDDDYDDDDYDDDDDFLDD